MNRKRNFLFGGFVLLTLAFIWGNSLMPPDRSWFVSNAVQEVLARLLPAGVGAAVLEEGGGSLVRKLAHFSEFFLLGGLICLWLRAHKLPRRLPLAALLPLLTALLDETIQAYNGRTSSVFDVWLDFAGAASAVAILCGVAALRAHRRRAKKRSGNKDRQE